MSQHVVRIITTSGQQADIGCEKIISIDGEPYTSRGDWQAIEHELTRQQAQIDGLQHLVDLLLLQHNQEPDEVNNGRN